MSIQLKNKIQNYDAADLGEVHSLAKQHLSWVNSLVSTVIQNNKTGKTYHNEELLNIAQYLSDVFADEHNLQREKYHAEYDVNKKAVTL
ncbi:hypothetical protein QR665_12155 [Acinetobacter gerneri]|uniref:hypothetical protein n=1 Tax=Acinetobacter gerneri TaxID=202952 RepID=UPI00293607DE|nr:hypothetical protein [Acinetobacter gerneri]MDV2440215.1 hypothetical protein [Acinetobacter gerneri]